LERKKGFGEDFLLLLNMKKKIIGTVMGRYDCPLCVSNYLVIALSVRGMVLERCW
tara:strand:- start:364 stop:528 length:165 start_codon:yes stop_codon:yes gene_type:complete